ncbi:hypothetical protein H8L57_24775 [Klebsiella pneumoniae]|nr:hypothetical protein [Klebsiella pneumoniae]HBR4785426.1 hypothetical protein [Klebsiella pneumoniae]
MSDINVQEIFAKSQDNSVIGELADTISAMEKKPTSLRQISDLLTKAKKDNSSIQFDEADVGRNNGYRVSPSWLYVEPGFNLRDLNIEQAEMFKGMWLRGARIPAILVKVVILNGVTRLKIIDGHHRFAGLMAAINEGANIPTVPIEEYTGNSADEIFEMLKSAQGLALKPIERAEGFRRLRGWNLSIEDIAAGSGNNVQTVRRSLILVDAEENVKALVREEKVSADVAINLLVECKGTERDVYKELLASLEEAQKAGKTKVTARFVKSKKVSVKPKVIRETFTSLLPASNQIRSQIERVKTDDTTDPDAVSINIPADAARMLLAVLEQYEASQNAGAAEQEENADTTELDESTDTTEQEESADESAVEEQ